jgi:O-methyltransferase involved in polyketide biosynthesis
MQEGKGSRTAERVAERRAAHQVRDRPLVFEDPLALRVIDPEVARALREHPPAR